jgi:AraC-like DNA-binding protein
MLRGKKVMHLFDTPQFEYLPGETVIVPSNVEMKIDFPEASKDNPTQCIALAIDHKIITDTLGFLNEKYPKEGKNNLWKLDQENYFFYNNIELAGTINKLIKECMSTSITKDAIADITLQELIIRIIQTQTVKKFEDEINDVTSPITSSINFIRDNIRESINLKQLSGKACMSTTSFYRSFKRELGMSPIEFILNEKIKQLKTLKIFQVEEF